MVYPGDFVIPRSVADEDGVVHEYDDEVLGEAWEGGPVLLSWFEGDDAPAAASTWSSTNSPTSSTWATASGRLPAPARRHERRRLGRAFQPAYDDFCRRVDDGEDTASTPTAPSIRPSSSP
jgi:Mlc titration factor MtfA (ptsG expression regulator)